VTGFGDLFDGDLMVIEWDDHLDFMETDSLWRSSSLGGSSSATSRGIFFDSGLIL
jgi:hypothetical protein